VATAESTGTVVIIDGSAGQSQPLRDGLSDRWQVAESIASAGSERYGLVSISDGANSALQHAIQNPERVDVLVLVSPTAIRPAAGDAKAAADTEARLPDVQCPTLVVFGRDDKSVQPDAASTYRERIPNCNIAFVYAAGHDIAADRPQALINLVSDYLERRETFIVQNRSSVINP
jgi:pimeloyl-ACP methyl ester carboxylesterase